MSTRFASHVRVELIWSLALLGFLLCAVPGFAANSYKFGVVDPQAVLEKSIAGKRALAEIKQYAAARQKIINGDEQELKRLEQELKDKSGTGTDEEKRQRQMKFRQKVQAYQQRLQEFNQELASKQKEMVGEYMKKISKATQAVAERRGLSLVMDKGSETTMKIVIWNKASIDLTNQVVKEFNRRYK